MDRAVGRRRANPAGLIYGVLAIATIDAAESSRSDTYARLLAANAVTLLLYWFAHAYSHHWGSRLHQSSSWTIKELASSLAEESTILVGAVIPTVVLLGAWLAGASFETGVVAVLWIAGVELVLLEIATGIRRHLAWRDLAVQSAIGITLGLGILVVWLLMH